MLTLLVLFATLLKSLLFIRPKNQALRTLLWIPKLLAGGLIYPLTGLAGLGALEGLRRRDWKLFFSGGLGLGLAARFLRDTLNTAVPMEARSREREAARQKAQPSLALRVRRILPKFSPLDAAQLLKDEVLGESPATGKPLLGDVWLPWGAQRPSGLGLIYAHASGWRIGSKDLGTRPLFRRLAAQGHVVLDVAYTLWPPAGPQEMVQEINLSRRWLVNHGPAYGVAPEKIVLMGASAGAYLALLAAYTSEDPETYPSGVPNLPPAFGVVAFYPPVDLYALQADQIQSEQKGPPNPVERLANWEMRQIFMLEAQYVDPNQDERIEISDLIAEMLGGLPSTIPEIYQQLSPINYVGSHCPPTLFLQGRDDVFGLAPGVRQMHQQLLDAGVNSILVEFPHAEHIFDLVFPTISPLAQSAIGDVEAFLNRLALGFEHPAQDSFQF